MSSTLDVPAADLTPPISGGESETVQSAWANQAEKDDFDYVPVSPWGPISLVLGLCSFTGLMNSVFGLVLAFMSVVVGLVATLKIRGDQGAVKGSGMALVGTVLSVMCLVFGSMKLSHAYQTECPEGYQRVNFPNEISDRQFVYYGSRRRLHPEVAPLIEQKIFLKGFMWQTQKAAELTDFVLLKDNGECCFGGEPKPYDMMQVNMAGEQTTPGYTGMIAVAGTLHAEVNAADGEPVYTLDADMVEEAQTSF